MTRRTLGAWLVAAGSAWLGGMTPAVAQTSTASVTVPTVRDPGPYKGFFAAPGNYGMSFGSPSYGTVRANSSFSSPYGLGYGYGYNPYGLIPGRYGVGLWRPGYAEPPLYNAGDHSYRTFPVPYSPHVSTVTPPIGYYAPGFGPPATPGR